MILPTGRGLPDWTAGTATATQGLRNVSFAGAGLIATDATTGAQIYAAGRGDFFMIDGVDAVQISAVIDANTIQLARPWNAATQNGVPYAIIRMSIPATGSLAKAIKDIYDQGSDAKPDTTRTLDDSTARIKIDPHAGAPAIRVGASGAADEALKEGIAFDKDAGYARFPSGLLLPAAGNRNRFINGNFDIWQRGTAFSVAAGDTRYIADRFQAANGLGAGIPAAVSKVAAPAGFIGASALNWQATGVTPGGYLDIIQRFESQMVWDLDGQDCVLSFDLSASTSAGAMVLTVFVLANSAPDNNSWSILQYQSDFNVPGGASRIKVPIPAVATVGLKNGFMLGIRINQISAVGNPNVTIGAVQMERGLVVNPFEFRPIGVEMALCQRYYWSLPIVGGPNFFHPIDNSHAFRSMFIGFPVRMRGTPSCTMTGVTSGAFETGYPIVESATPDYACLRADVTNLNDWAYLTSFTASAEL